MIREILESIKEIFLDYIKHRLFPVTVLILVLFSILFHRLFVLQIVEGDQHMDNFIYKSEKTLSIEGVRGNIYDRNGNIIAYNELSYSLIYSNDPNISNYAKEQGVSENALKNDILYQTITILEKNGDTLKNDFPITFDKDGNYKFKIKAEQLKDFLKNVYAATSYDSLTDEQKNSTAEDVVNYLCGQKMFDISEDYQKNMRLNILACRYKLWLNRYQQYVPVTIAFDLSDESNSAISEHKDHLYGMDVSVRSLRRYNDSVYYAHIIGYVGAINADELKSYNQILPASEQYAGTEMVGKIGIEQYCEQYLRGINGSETMYVDNLGKVLETIETTPAEAGNDVYLTIDTDLQKYCYDTLEKELASIIIAELVPDLYVDRGEFANIPISDVYYGLFRNNYLSVEKMNEEDATDLEKQIYTEFNEKKVEALSRLRNILLVDFTSLTELNIEYRAYMEYICETLNRNGIFNPDKLDHKSKIYVEYVNNLISLEEFLKYAISEEAIDITKIDTASAYYDNDEVYTLLCEYVLEYLADDPDFELLILQCMLQSGEITGYSVINLIYSQGVLDPKDDELYLSFQLGECSPYEFIRTKILNLELTPAMLGLDPCSGSVVVTDVNTGDILAMVSYPSYDINLLTNEVNSDYYNRLLEDKTTPLVNRATQQKTAPGSTFKPLATIACLNEGLRTSDEYYFCSGTFDLIQPEAHCWLLGGHGAQSAETAIYNSCNGYFYNVGYNLALTESGYYNDALGLQRLSKYTDMLGLSEKSGVELAEAKPNVSNRDAVRSCIGQGTHSYTPIQLSRYVTTVANSGTCYNLTLIDKVCDYDGNIIVNNEATVRNQIEIDEHIWDVVHTGMREVVTIHTGKDELINQIDVSVAGKTGTAQESEIRSDHALFVSYAPYESPEVSVTCVIPFGYYSGNARELASFIYAYMYDPEKLEIYDMKGNSVTQD